MGQIIEIYCINFKWINKSHDIFWHFICILNLLHFFPLFLSTLGKVRKERMSYTNKMHRHHSEDWCCSLKPVIHFTQRTKAASGAHPAPYPTPQLLALLSTVQTAGVHPQSVDQSNPPEKRVRSWCNHTKQKAARRSVRFSQELKGERSCYF